ncbi:uncharacterized protein LOC127874556 [Dreissena polymorpha]|nr:uncharacterized protein LOC127874556 [Dreissena polymorpha]
MNTIMKCTSFCSRSTNLIKRLYHMSKYTVEIPNVSIGQYILNGFNKRDDKIALVEGITDKKTTFAELHEQIQHVTSNLSALGFGPGHVACLCGFNAPEFAHVFCSVTLLGGALTIANPQLTAGELQTQVNETGTSVLFVTPDCVEKAKVVSQTSKQIRHVIVVGHHHELPTLEKLMRPRPHVTPVVVDPASHVALLPFSSGTTGLPKGVMLTHRNLVAELAALSHEHFLPFGDGDSSLAALPMVHIAGLVIGLLNPLSQGAAVVTLPRFQPDTFLASLEKYKTTFSLIAPPVVNFLATDPSVERYDLSHWRTPYSGAAPLGKDLTETVVRKLGLTGLRQGYGMSETSPATHTTPLDWWKYGSIGVPLPNTESKVVDIDTMATLNAHAHGEIWVRGPQVMKGYLNKPEATRETLMEDGWLRTGDIGYYDDDGHYFVVDRLKEIIKYKGYQIAPAYLESVLLQHPAVCDAAVVGKAHPVHGHLPTAYVVCNTSVTADDIAQFVNMQVAPYKRLRGGVNIVKELPRSPSGKILRKNLL